MEVLEDEDYELQAALQASLMGESSEDVVAPPFAPSPLVQANLPFHAPGPASGQGSGTHTPTQLPYPVMPPYPTGSADIDPVAASMERNRFMLQRMKEQQEFAQRELWAEGGARPGAGGIGIGRRPGDDDEEEMLRRAIEESEASARVEGHGQDEDEDADEDAEGDIDLDIDEPRIPSAKRNEYPAPPIDGGGDRVYDDDDAELQAALKESLEHVPSGWVPPELQPHHTPPSLPAHPSGVVPEYVSASRGLGRISEGGDRSDVESLLSDETSTTPSSDSVEVAAETVSVDELRRRRLARFGA
jgi:ataxin-3